MHATIRSHEPDTPTGRVVVVGAGLAGLVAANHLVGAGLEVTVLDGAGHAGGRAHSTTSGGAVRNLGIHAVYRRGNLARELAALDLDVAGRSPNLATARVLQDGRDRHGLALLATVLPGLLRLRHRPAPGRSLDQWLDELGIGGATRSVVLALARTTTYADAPGLVDATAVRDQLRLGLGGVTYVDGGWQSLVDALVARLHEMGGRVVTGAGVERVEVDSCARVVQRDGHLHDADGVVVAVGGPADAGRLLAGPLGASLRDRRDLPIRMATLDLVLEATDGRPGPTQVFGDGSDPRYVLVQSRVARLAHADREVVHVARYLAPDERADAATRRDLEDLLERFQPGWQRRVVDARFLPGLTVSHALPLAASGGRAGRSPVVPHGDLPLALAGDGFGDQGLLADAAAASGAAAARHVAARVAARSPAGRAA